jgi:XRE family transcriptional regulator, regulator of sulfur utilization
VEKRVNRMKRIPKMKTKAADYDFSILRELRGQRNISLEDLARKTGVSFSTLLRIESNQNTPNLATLKVLSGFFGMTPAQLLGMATSFVVEHGEEKLENLGRVKRRGVTFGDVRLRVGSASKGDHSAKPHQHLGEDQITWVLEGRMSVKVHGEEYPLSSGEALKFDASFEHQLEFLQSTTYVVALVPRRSR